MGRGSRSKLWIVLIVLALVAAAGFLGYRAWRSAEQRSLIVSGLPRRPPLDRARPELKARVAQAEEEARHGADPLGALQTLSRLYDANGYAEAAAKCYERLSQLEPEEPRWPHLRATVLAGFGQLEEAVPLWVSVLRRAPDYLPARIRLADALLKLNRVDEAQQTYRDVLSHDPRSTYARLGLARCEMEKQLWSQAEENLTKAVQADPNFSAAWQLLASLAEKRGDTAAAASAQREAAKGQRYQDIPDAWADALLEDCYDPYKLRVAAATMESGSNVAGAQRALQRALTLAPNDPAAHRELGRLLLDQGNIGGAREQLDKATALAPDDSENWIGLFKLASAAHDSAEMKRVVLAGLSHCPNSPTLRLEHGRQLLADGDAKAALAEFNEAKRLRPNEPDALVQIGIAYLYLGDTAHGIAAMQDVLRVQPDHPMALLTLARFTIDAGNEREARQWIDRLRQQTRTRPEDVREISALFQQRFGAAP
ncbi:MAG TPA: tetratricopeptide repeat protein [Opitutaceae bacterium]|nr:tetratricopeptide repeat protein [Opitutaceae bacterium]